MTTWDYRSWLEGDEADGEGRAAPRRPAPGKVSLTAHLQPAVQRRASPSPASRDGAEHLARPVRRRASGSEADQAWRAAFDFDFTPVQLAAAETSNTNADTVLAAAARGIEAPSQSLPHLEQIQESFGKHNVSRVQAHVGGAAAEATAAMGAEAYATGSHVVFASPPDLHTAAHEAAHIVQQRGGAQLEGGVGEADDAYERHADAVADKVVAGESAEALLGETAGEAQREASAVQHQRRGRGQAPPSPPAGASVGPSTTRVIASPRDIKFRPTEYGQATYEQVTLFNTSEKPFHVHDLIRKPLPDLDGTERADAEDGDFAIVGGETGGDGLAPGGSMMVTIAFSPKASSSADLTRKKHSWRNAQFSVMDAEGATGGSFKVRGPARPPKAETTDARAVAEATASARTRSKTRPPAPQTYAEMRHLVMAARDLVRTSEREEAADLLDDVVARLNKGAHYDLVFEAAKKHGLGSTTAVTAVGKARDEVTHAARKLHDTKGPPVQMDLVLTAFEVAREPLQLTLGEIDHAPGLQAMHDAAPAVLAGKGVVELGITAKRIVTDAAFAAGFGLGVLEGAGGAIRDLATGVIDTLALAFEIARTFVTSGLIGTAIHVAGKVGDFFDKAPLALAAMGRQFKEDWNHPDSFACGNFRGEVIGYVATQIAILIISGGVAAEGVAFASLSRWGKLVEIVRTLDSVGDITAWAQRAGKGISGAQRALLEKIRKGRKGPATRMEAPDSSGPDGLDSAGEPPNHVNTPEVDIVPDRTRAPYEDPRDDDAAPRRPLDKRELIPHRKLDAKTSWKEVERAQRRGDVSFAVGAKLKSADEGHAILARLSSGDISALEKVGISDFPRSVDPTGREWALIEVRDGFAIYAGGYRRVDLPTEARVLGHTHPGPDPSVKETDVGPAIDRRLNVDESGRSVSELLDDLANARDSGILPSAADINAISDGTPHVLYTRYVHVGDGRVANPLPGDTRPRVQMHMTDAKVVRWDPRRQSYYYEVRVTARDATGKELWSGRLYAAWHKPLRGGDTFVKRPAILDRAPSAEWQVP